MFPDDWQAKELLLPVLIVGLITASVIVWSYWGSRIAARTKWLLCSMKLAALFLLALCLLEPTRQISRPVPGENLLVIVADDSLSLNIRDRTAGESRADQLKPQLDEAAPWLVDLNEQFDVRYYTMNSKLVRQNTFADYSAEHPGSSIGLALQTLANRFEDRPLAGMVMLTDGNTTDALDVDALESLPPVFPVVVGRQRPARDIAIESVVCSQTNFESAPVTITVELRTTGYAGEDVVVQLLNSEGNEIQKREITKVRDDALFSVRFQLKPEEKGIAAFEVKAVSGTDAALPPKQQGRSEATFENNRRTVLVDRGKGPFRILYVSGRPNWEFKFLRRAIADDHELDLVGLIRMAKREPKFKFREQDSLQSNQFFRGFADETSETVERYDEPVLVRFGTRDQLELKDGFPKDEATLFNYDAVILDDIESEFFTEDQKGLLKKFVTSRGGGLLMLGGSESFAGSGFDHTPIAEMLPVYVDAPRMKPTKDSFRLQLTRDGWIQPWVRLRSTEAEERIRINEMPPFQTLNPVSSIKPGATVLSTVRVAEAILPALVVQGFGRGRSAAILIGDLWRWQLKSPAEIDDLKKAWRQTLRWLVSDVPQRVEIEFTPPETTLGTAQIRVRTSDPTFSPTDNAKLDLQLTSPKGDVLTLVAQPSPTEAGVFSANFSPREPGPYRILAKAEFPANDEVLSAEAGWVSDATSEEFRQLEPNSELLEQIAGKTDGKSFSLDELSSLSREIVSRPTTNMETLILPWWHRWTFFLIAIGLLVGEWGMRRWKGLP